MELAEGDCCRRAQSSHIIGLISFSEARKKKVDTFDIHLQEGIKAHLVSMYI